MRVNQGIPTRGRLTLYRPTQGMAVASPSLSEPAQLKTDYQTETVVLPDGLIPNFNVRSISPRQVQGLSMELYALGVIPWEEYGLLAFQAELHPDFNRTIGALTGEKADPVRERDYIALWEERVAFERRHNTENPERIRRAEHIAGVLRRMSMPTNIEV